MEFPKAACVAVSVPDKREGLRGPEVLTEKGHRTVYISHRCDGLSKK